MQLKAVHSGMGSSLLDDVSRGGGGGTKYCFSGVVGLMGQLLLEK